MLNAGWCYLTSPSWKSGHAYISPLRSTYPTRLTLVNVGDPMTTWGFIPPGDGRGTPSTPEPKIEKVRRGSALHTPKRDVEHEKISNALNLEVRPPARNPYRRSGWAGKKWIEEKPYPGLTLCALGLSRSVFPAGASRRSGRFGGTGRPGLALG
eukprot:1180889-Prorocentrum_minimum.AAC.8